MRAIFRLPPLPKKHRSSAASITSEVPLADKLISADIQKKCSSFRRGARPWAIRFECLRACCCAQQHIMRRIDDSSPTCFTPCAASGNTAHVDFTSHWRRYARPPARLPPGASSLCSACPQIPRGCRRRRPCLMLMAAPADALHEERFQLRGSRAPPPSSEHAALCSEKPLRMLTRLQLTIRQMISSQCFDMPGG